MVQTNAGTQPRSQSRRESCALVLLMAWDLKKMVMFVQQGHMKRKGWWQLTRKLRSPEDSIFRPPRTHSWAGWGWANPTGLAQNCCIFHSIVRLRGSCTQVSSFYWKSRRVRYLTSTTLSRQFFFLFTGKKVFYKRLNSSKRKKKICAPSCSYQKFFLKATKAVISVDLE